MMRSLMPYGVCMAVALVSGSTVTAQTALGGAAGSTALLALRDSPNLGIQDHAGLFQPDAVLKARAAIQQFRHEYHRDLFIETFDHPPGAEPKRGFLAWGRSQAEPDYVQWSTTRARAIGIDGIYVLICKKPKHVQVLLYPNTPEQAFTEDNVRELRKLLERELPQSPDAALSDAVAFVHNQVKDNLAERDSAAKSIGLQTIVLIVAGIVGFWLFLSLVRGVLHRAGGSGDPAHGSLTSGFFGALFGTTAGHWVYDRLFRAHPPAAPQPESEFLHGPASQSESTSEPHDQEEHSTWGR